MFKPQPVTAKNFGEVVKTWSQEKFIEIFTPIYKGVDLVAIASELGLQKEAKKQRSALSDKPGAEAGE